jgi:hypothetical protein
MIIAHVGLKQPLTINGWPDAVDQTAALGTGDLHKRRHTFQTEGAPVVAERAGKHRIIIQIDMAAVSQRGQSTGSRAGPSITASWRSSGNAEPLYQACVSAMVTVGDGLRAESGGLRAEHRLSGCLSIAKTQIRTCGGLVETTRKSGGFHCRVPYCAI